VPAPGTLPEEGDARVRKRLAIVGHSREGLELVPLLEANPDVEICALVSDDPPRARDLLEELDPGLVARLGARVTDDLEAVLATPGLHAVVDADASPALRERLGRARAVQITTPVLAKLLYAFGPAAAFSKPDLLQALREILDSYNLTLDRRGLLDRVLQIAVTATGADRGSLMLWDARERALRMEVAIGIEEELIPKIRVSSGDGIAGRAFAMERAILLHGKADRGRYQITRERDDVESAISAPLVTAGDVIGVLNVSHARNRDVFGEEDLAFVEQLACLDAKIIARAEQYHGLVRESETLRAEARIRRLMAADEPLGLRLHRVCAHAADALARGVCQLYLRECEGDALVRQASSTGPPPLAGRERIALGEGLAGWVAAERRPVFLTDAGGRSDVCFAALPLVSGEELLGALAFQGGCGAIAEASDRMRAMAEALAIELAGALRAARLERESARGDALGDLQAALAACADERELARLVTESAVRLLEAEDAVLRLRDEASGSFRVASWSGLGQWRRAPLAAAERRLAQQVIRERRALRIADLETRPEIAARAAGVATAMVTPLLRDGRPVGTLSALGKAPDDPMLGERFDASDAAALERLAQHAQAALAELWERARLDRDRRFDPLTALPNAAQLRARLEEEIARSGRGGHTFALLELRFAGLEERLEQQRAGEGDRLALALAHALRRGLREFDVLARPGPELFTALVPEPDEEVPKLLTALSRAAREAIGTRADFDAPLELRIGYAVFPHDGADADALQARARNARVEAL
jgi:GAF domain-containing protein